MPKTRSLVPQYDQTPNIMKPDTDELLKFNDFRKKTKTTTMGVDKEQEFKAPKIPKKKIDELKPKDDRVIIDTESERGKKGKVEPEQQTSFDGRPIGTRRGVKGKSFKSFATSLVKLAKNNPALSLIGYDQLKSLQNPFALRGGRAGLRSAAR